MKDLSICDLMALIKYLEEECRPQWMGQREGEHKWQPVLTGCYVELATRINKLNDILT